MNLQLNKDNFNHTLNIFSTQQLESMLAKFPYFQQGHLLLAKKYQLENNAKFDEQLQLAALYTHDRELLFSIFNTPYDLATFETEKETIAETVTREHISEEVEATAIETTSLAVSETNKITPAKDFEIELQTKPVIELENVAGINEAYLPKTTDPIEPIEFSVTEVVDNETLHQNTVEEFDVEEPHTFNEWLNAYKTAEPQPIKLKLVTEKTSLEPEAQDKELEVLYLTNIPINLHELVQEETQYSKGLDKFIAEQIQKRKYKEPKLISSETDLDPELITETMAKVYEIQKKYTKAIRCYEILSLKYPKKIDLFAARINYLKNSI